MSMLHCSTRSRTSHRGTGRNGKGQNSSGDRIELRNRARYRAVARRRGIERRHQFLHGQRRRPCAGGRDFPRVRQRDGLHQGRYVRCEPVPGADRLGGRTVRDGRHSRQQCRDPACGADRGVPGRKVGCDHGHQSRIGLSHGCCRRADDARKRLGAGDQHRLRARPDSVTLQVRLCRGQARHGRPDQGDRPGDRRGSGDLQRDLPGICADAAGRGTDSRHDEAIRHGPRDGDPRHPCSSASPPSSSRRPDNLAEP